MRQDSRAPDREVHTWPVWPSSDPGGSFICAARPFYFRRDGRRSEVSDNSPLIISRGIESMKNCNLWKMTNFYDFHIDGESETYLHFGKNLFFALPEMASDWHLMRRNPLTFGRY
ncbi:Hypothetical protein NTJ_15567 [Nesidiocoris tenuis]|uniref:Uncharacterized protein n=1 Tax=Nesidiocoris tenuis TaxID=355587 RepID=A0ABN7BEE3_9HEMI|nr:Hypothetical protein NTJ_15567 [Nesidiocoris tenuis]